MSQLYLVIAVAMLSAIVPAIAANEPISRLPRVSETPADPDTAAAFAMIRSRGGSAASSAESPMRNLLACDVFMAS